MAEFVAFTVVTALVVFWAILPPSLDPAIFLRERLDAKRDEGREMFTCTACGSGPWDIAWDPHEQPVTNKGGGRICPNCSGAD